MTHANHRSAILAAGLVLTLVVGCSARAPQELIAAAKASIERNDPATAVVQLKDALQRDPDRPEARFLLGSLLLKQGSAVAAQIELRKALDLGHPEGELVPLLASAMLASGQANQLIKEWGGTQLGAAKHDARLQSTLANAHLVLGQSEHARERLDAALRLEPTLSSALLTKAQMTARAGDFASSLSQAEAILRLDPKNVAALTFKGDVEQTALGRLDDALESYRLAVEADPDYDPAHVAIVMTQLKLGRLDDAETQLKTLLEVSPKNPSARYLEALLTYQRGNFRLAKEMTQRILRVLPNSSRVLLLSAAAEAELGALSRAEDLLARAIQSEAGLVPAYRLLIAIQLRAGNHARALEVLNSLIERKLVDDSLLGLAGQVYLFNGDAERAQALFQRALSQDPSDSRKQTALAIARLAGGQAAAFDELQSIAKGSETSEADLALIAARLRRGEFDKSLEALSQLETKTHDKAMTANLRGQIQLAMNRRDDAKASFEAALTHNPRYFAAIANLAALDVARRDIPAAQARFEGVLKIEPRHVQALMSLARLVVMRGGDRQQAVVYLKQAIEAQPTNPAPRLLLVEFLVAQNDLKEALSAAQSAVITLPDSFEALDALGGVQQVMGATQQAITSYGKLVPMRPYSTHPYLRLAEAHLADQNKAGAAAQLRKALEVKPDSLEAQRGLILLAIDAKDYGAATEMAKRIQRQHPKDAAGYLLAADVARLQGDRSALLAAYRAGVEAAASSQLAARWHAALAESGKVQEAEQFSARWIREHPAQIDFLIYLGDAALNQGDKKAAQTYYALAVQRQPENALAQNNLAAVMAHAAKSDALAHALRATELSPGVAAFWDTLASAHAVANDLTAALAAQRKAVALAPTDPALQLQLAKLLIQAGDRPAAKEQLRQLSRLGTEFPGQSEVSALLSGL